MSTSLRASPRLHAIAAGLALFAFGTAGAADFTINGASSTAQSLGKGQLGTITASGVLTIGGSTVAITVTGNDATIDNQGAVSQTGTGRAIRDNTGVTGLVINNGAAALMQTADADVIQMNRPTASVTLNNDGRMISNNASAGGAQVVDFSTITSGVNVVNNFAGGLIQAFEADAVRPGVNGVVNNAGRIVSVTTTGSSSDGIDFQSNVGGVVVNEATGVVQGGRHGITGGADNASVNYAASITNRGTIQGDNGAGLNFDGFNGRQLVTVVNSGTIVGHGVTGDGDGVDVDGLVSITNTGTIRSVNAVSPPADGPAYSEGISVGGGTIVNSGLIEGLVSAGNTNAFGRGITLTGNDLTAGAREGLYGNAIVDNRAGGVIRGQNDSAIVATGAASGYTVSITNAAGGNIVGGGTSYAAIRTGLDDDTVTNRGTIDGTSSGKAIDLGAGNNRVNILGGNAFVLGSIDGGQGGTNLLLIEPGAGERFAYAGDIANFAKVMIGAGTTILSGASTYAGTTTIGPDGTLVLDGGDRLAAASALELAGGKLALTNGGQTFASLSLTADSAIDLGGSVLAFDGLGNIADGALLAVTGFLGGGGLNFLGDLAGDADFLELIANITLDGRAATYAFDGVSTRLIAIPEPSVVALLALGVVALGLARRRRPAA